MSQILKVQYNKETHIYRGPQTYEQLNLYIKNIFTKKLPQAYILTYTDEENDEITISCQNDIDAMKESQQKSYKIIIKDQYIQQQQDMNNINNNNSEYLQVILQKLIPLGIQIEKRLRQDRLELSQGLDNCYISKPHISTQDNIPSMGESIDKYFHILEKNIDNIFIQHFSPQEINQQQQQQQQQQQLQQLNDNSNISEEQEVGENPVAQFLERNKEDIKIQESVTNPYIGRHYEEKPQEEKIQVQQPYYSQKNENSTEVIQRSQQLQNSQQFQYSEHVLQLAKDVGEIMGQDARQYYRICELMQNSDVEAIVLALVNQPEMIQEIPDQQ